MTLTTLLFSFISNIQQILNLFSIFLYYLKHKSAHAPDIAFNINCYSFTSFCYILKHNNFVKYTWLIIFPCSHIIIVLMTTIVKVKLLYLHLVLIHIMKHNIVIQICMLSVPNLMIY
jgi:hypothetical protein